MNITDYSSHAAIHILMDPKQAAQTVTAYRALVSPDDQTRFFAHITMNLAGFWAITLESVSEPARSQLIEQLTKAKNGLPSLTDRKTP